MTFFQLQRIIYALVALIFILGLAKLLAGHGHFTSAERISAFLFFLAALGGALVWALEREDTIRGLKEGTISRGKRNLIGTCISIASLSALLWWFTHPNAADRWVWFLGAVLFGGIGLVFILKKPKASK